MNELALLNKLYLESSSQEEAITKYVNYIPESKSVDKSKLSFGDNSVYEDYLSKLNGFQKYKREVWRITNSQDLKSLPDFDKRGFTGFHLDHKYSISHGYKNKIDPFVIGDISNLRMIPYKENMAKGSKSLISDNPDSKPVKLLVTRGGAK